MVFVKPQYCNEFNRLEFKCGIVFTTQITYLPIKHKKMTVKINRRGAIDYQNYVQNFMLKTRKFNVIFRSPNNKYYPKKKTKRQNTIEIDVTPLSHFYKLFY